MPECVRERERERERTAQRPPLHIIALKLSNPSSPMTSSAPPPPKTHKRALPKKFKTGQKHTRTRQLLRRIRHIVAIIRRIARIVLERMQQPIPMPDLMHGRAALIILQERTAARHRRAQDIAPVERVVARVRLGRDACARQRAVAQQDGAGGNAGRAGRGLQVGLEVDVEGGVGAAAQAGFHGEVVAVGGPGGVDGARGGYVAEADAGVGVGGGHGVELRGGHGVSDVGGGGGEGGGGVGDDVEIGVDGVVGV